jgi:hypothetical protein
MSKGIISGVTTFEDGVQLYQITAPISPASSGGPVLSRDGELLGMATAASDLGQSLNFAIPSSAVAELIADAKPGETTTLAAAARLRSPERRALMREMVEISDVQLSMGYPRHRVAGDRLTGLIDFSVVNRGNVAVRGVKLLLVYTLKGTQEDAAPLHYTPVSVAQTILPGLAARVQAKDPVILDEHRRFQATTRVLDWVYVEGKAPALQFVPAK